MQDECDTYTYSGKNCILIHRSDHPDSLKFLASEQSPVFEKGKYFYFVKLTKIHSILLF